MSYKNTNNLAIIGASYLQLPLIEKAKEMGFVTHVFAWKADDVGEYAADRFYPISITQKEAILEECKKIGICGICSIASDLAVTVVDYVANNLGLVGNTAGCTLKSTNKYAMRQAFQQGGDPSPWFLLLEHHTPLPEGDEHYPAVVKPTDRSGSRGVVVVHDVQEAARARDDAIAESFERKALMEGYVQGAEYSLEGISWKGVHQILQITQKETTGSPFFVETGHVQPAPLDASTYEKAQRIVVHALDTLGIQYGATHSEIKITDDGQIYIIEIGARMGGDCIGSDLVPLTTGIDYMRAVIQIACGEEPDLHRGDHIDCASVRYILGPQDVAQMRKLQEEQPERLLRIPFLKDGACARVVDSSGRTGCYIVRG